MSEKGDPLETVIGLVPWESFRTDIEAVVLTPKEAKRSKAGRMPLDALELLRMLVLQENATLSSKSGSPTILDPYVRHEMARQTGRSPRQEMVPQPASKRPRSA